MILELGEYPQVSAVYGYLCIRAAPRSERRTHTHTLTGVLDTQTPHRNTQMSTQMQNKTCIASSTPPPTSGAELGRISRDPFLSTAVYRWRELPGPAPLTCSESDSSITSSFRLISRALLFARSDFCSTPMMSSRLSDDGLNGLASQSSIIP